MLSILDIRRLNQKPDQNIPVEMFAYQTINRIQFKLQKAISTKHICLIPV